MFETEEMMSKKITYERIADLLRFQTPLNEKTKELIKKIVEDAYLEAVILEKIREGK